MKEKPLAIKKMEQVAGEALPNYRKYLKLAARELTDAMVKAESEGHSMDAIRIHMAGISAAAMYYATLMKTGIEVHQILVPQPQSRESIRKLYLELIEQELDFIESERVR